MIKKVYISLLLTLSFTGCVEYKDDPLCKDYRFVSLNELRTSIKAKEAVPIEKIGKMYVYQNLLLISDGSKGIHIVDNQDKFNPQNIAYLNVIENVDMAVKDGYLYVDSLVDLVVIDLNNLTDIKESSRVENIFSYTAPLLDDYKSVESECHYSDEPGFIIKVQK
jgi:hypothetical protein